MKKKLLMVIMLMALAVGMTACGDKEPVEDNTKVKESQEKDTEEKDAEDKGEAEEKKEEEMELPNWKGVYDFQGSIGGKEGEKPYKGFGIDIAYPSSHPSTVGGSSQRDPAIALVAFLDSDEEFNMIGINNVEEAFEGSMKHLIDYTKDCVGSHIRDMEFIVDEQETMTINDMPTCRYAGVCKYTDIDEEITLPFVAYSFYTGQVEKYSYFTVMVLDESVNRPNLDPLPEGTIEAYARKMVESVKIREDIY